MIAQEKRARAWRLREQILILISIIMPPLYLIAKPQASLYIQLLTSVTINEIVYTSEKTKLAIH